MIYTSSYTLSAGNEDNNREYAASYKGDWYRVLTPNRSITGVYNALLRDLINFSADAICAVDVNGEKPPFDPLYNGDWDKI